MNRMLILIAALGGLTGWLLFAPTGVSASSPSNAAQPTTAAPRRSLASWVTSSAVAAPALAAPARAPVTSVQLTGERLRQRIDAQIPSLLYAEAAKCYRGGLPSDQRMDLSYHLVVAGGELSITDAQVDSSTLSDPALARCIVERVFAFRARDAQLPDYQGDGDLFVRVGGFKPFLARVGTDGDQPLQ
jgi:hypothetical protein